MCKFAGRQFPLAAQDFWRHRSASLCRFRLAAGSRRCRAASLEPNGRNSTSMCRRPIAKAATAAPDAAVPAVDWWRGFRSSELTSLMEQRSSTISTSRSPSPRSCRPMRRWACRAPRCCRRSREPRPPSRASATPPVRWPLAGGIGGPSFSQYSLGLTASYMVDFWGKNRATLYAAEESATASRYNREVVTLTTIVTRRQHLFPGSRRAGRTARRAAQSGGGRAHSHAHQAAIRRRHRLATRPVAAGGAGRDRARRDPAARGHAAAEHRRARPAGRRARRRTSRSRAAR